MSCGCPPGAPPGDGWRLIPEMAMAMNPLTTTPPPSAPLQPDRAPPSPSVPIWLWVVIAIVTIAALSKKGGHS